MNAKLKFVLTTAWILFSRCYDAYCTNQLTPDLSKEGNPLVSVLGLTWLPLLVVLSFLTIYTIYVYYISEFKPLNILPKEKGYTLSNMVAFTYLGYKAEWFEAFYRLPKGFHRFNHYLGKTLPPCLVFAGVVSTIMWVLINHTDFYAAFHRASVIYGILLIGCCMIIYTWNKKMYQVYLTLP